MPNTAKTDRDYLRQVDIEGYALRIWEALSPTGVPLRMSTGQYRVGYEFCTPDGEVLFTGDDYGCSPMHAIDSDDCLRGILGFLTLHPGDTDAEYFEKYTDAQMAFANGDGELLSMWAMDDGTEDFQPLKFVNLDDWEG